MAQDACFWSFVCPQHGAMRFFVFACLFCIMPPRRPYTEMRSARSFIELKHLSNLELCALRKRLLNDANALEAIKSTTLHRIDKESTAYFDMIAADPIKYEIEDGVFTLEYLDPSLMVQLVTQEAPRFAALYLDKFSTKPCTREAPWHAIIAFDEFNPGNATARTD